jgi:tetratricopeptide (TPR) repeat protein
MSKRRQKHKERGKGPFSIRPFWSRQPALDLEATLERVRHLVENGQAQEAIDFLEPLLVRHPNVAELHHLTGYAYVMGGHLWVGLDYYERALELGRNPEFWLPVVSLYVQLELNAHALDLFRRASKRLGEATTIAGIRQMVDELEMEVAQTARQLALSQPQMEKGLLYLEQGQRALHRDDLQACVTANRRAVQLLGDWPPPHNNLSLALFYSGQPDEALAVARRVLAKTPDNVQALSNAIRFLSWTGKETEAHELWARLHQVVPQEDADLVKKADAAAVLGYDEIVYQLLQPLDKKQIDYGRLPMPVQHFLAVAEANTGRSRAAQRRFKELEATMPQARRMREALQARRPGPGWADRYPYFQSSDLLFKSALEEFMTLLERQDRLDSTQFKNRMARFAVRYPQIVLAAKKLLWEEEQPEAGISLLVALGTPAAYDALREFGLSQVGDDELRLQALLALSEAGQLAPNEPVQLWSRGEWSEVQLRQIELSDEPDNYSPEVVRLLNEGHALFTKKDYDKAQRLFQQALARDPRAKAAYNNLGTIYSIQKKYEQAQAMYRAAMEIDPLYVFPRCNLVGYLLMENDVEGAKEMLAPLAQLTRFHPQEMAVYSYAQARIQVHEQDYDAAHRSLELALQIMPDYPDAQELLERVEFSSTLLSGFREMEAQRRIRADAKRRTLQSKLSTADAPLSSALGLYTKEVLTAMARIVLPPGGWSTLRKAALFDKVLAALLDRDILQDVVAGLNEEEQVALRMVLSQGGSMSWEEFDRRYGNDLEESPYWHYHEPATLMGRLRVRGLLIEVTVQGKLLIAVPLELRPMLLELL